LDLFGLVAGLNSVGIMNLVIVVGVSLADDVSWLS